jgi:hypothetical protein
LAERLPGKTSPEAGTGSASDTAEPAQTASGIDASLDSGGDGRALAAWYLSASDVRVVSLLPIWGGVVVFVIILMLRHTFYDAHAALKQSRRDLVALQPDPVPEEENAALVYANVALAPYAGPSKLEPSSLLEMDGRLLDRPEIAQYIKNNAAQLKAIHQAASMPCCNWDLDYTQGFSIPLPYLSQVRAYARILALEARIKARAGDHAGAARNVREMMTLADHMDNDPILICGLVACAIRSIAIHAVEAIVWWEPPDQAAQLRAYKAALGTPADPRSQYVRAMEVERRMGLLTADQLSTQKLPLTALTGQPEPALLSLFIGAERDCLDRTYRELASGDGKTENSGDVLEIVDRNRSGSAVLASMLLPVAGKVLTQFTRVEEHRRLSIVGLALLEYRLVHGKDAAALELLIPGLLAELPLDENADQPRMRVDSTGLYYPDHFQSGKPLPRRGPGLIRVYYCGENKRDDGGMSHWRDDGPGGNTHPDADDPAFHVPPSNWDPQTWPTPESLGAPKLPVPKKSGTTPDSGEGKNP